jgi:hypothetical protein
MEGTMARTTDEIRADMKALEIEKESPGEEPVTTSGWYRNQDGTYTRHVWCNGCLQSGPTVRTYGDGLRHDELNLEGAEAFSREYADRQSSRAR